VKARNRSARGCIWRLSSVEERAGWVTRCRLQRWGVLLVAGQVAVQRGLGDAGLGGDLPEREALGFEELGVLDGFGGGGDRPADVAAACLGDRAGVRGALGGERAFHLGEQGDQQERHHRLPMTQVFGTGTLSSSDGQRFPVKGKSLTARHLSRYFARGQGLSTYTHLSDQHATFDTRVIVATAPEGHYVLDALLGNDTDLPLWEHATDTAGATLANFALFDLVG